MSGGKVGVEPRSDFRDAVAAIERQMIGRAIQTDAGRMVDVVHDLGIEPRRLNKKIVKISLDENALL